MTYLDLSREILPRSRPSPPPPSCMGATSIFSPSTVHPAVEPASWAISWPGPPGEPRQCLPDIFYLARDGRWEKQPTPERTRVVLDAAVSEMSVRYHPESGQWLSVYMGLEKNGDRLLYRTAPDLEGPWSEARTLVVHSRDRPGQPRYDGNNFCYAGKEHSSFARAGNWSSPTSATPTRRTTSEGGVSSAEPLPLPSRRHHANLMIRKGFSR